MNNPGESDTPSTPRACCGSFLDYIENNPGAAVVQALAVGFAVGLAVRILEKTGEKTTDIDVKHKPTLDEAKFHVGSLLLPFLWPAWKKVQESYGKSAGTAHDTIEKLKKSDLTAEGKKRLHMAEEWAEQEAARLAQLGRDKAKDLERWIEKGVLPTAECGIKKLRKYFGI